MIKCCYCGRFIGYKQIDQQQAKHVFQPDSIVGPEISYYICVKCTVKDNNESIRRM